MGLGEPSVRTQELVQCSNCLGFKGSKIVALDELGTNVYRPLINKLPPLNRDCYRGPKKKAIKRKGVY